MSDLPSCIQNIGIERAPSTCGGANCQTYARRLSCIRRKLSPRQHLFLQGDAQNHVYLVKSGAMCLYKLLRNGRRQIIGFKFPGELIALGHDTKYRFCAQAIAATELRSFQSHALHAAAVEDSRLMSKLYESVAGDLARAYDLALSVGQRDAEDSVATFLLTVETRAKAESADGETLSLPMSRSDIADYLGLSLETVSRIFTGFKRRGFIELSGRRGVRLVDRGARAPRGGDPPGPPPAAGGGAARAGARGAAPRRPPPPAAEPAIATPMKR